MGCSSLLIMMCTSAVPAMRESADHVQKQPNLFARHHFSRRKPPVFKPSAYRWQREMVDFAATFWNCECVCVLCEKAFISKYQRWCKKYSYNFSEDRALDIYASARSHFGVMPKTDTARLLAERAVSQLRTACAALAALKLQNCKCDLGHLHARNIPW